MASSFRIHCTARPASPVPAHPPIKYVNGETRYIKIQKPGRAEGGCRTPLNVRVRLNSRVAILPAVSASGMAAMTM